MSSLTKPKAAELFHESSPKEWLFLVMLKQNFHRPDAIQVTQPTAYKQCFMTRDSRKSLQKMVKKHDTLLCKSQK